MLYRLALLTTHAELEHGRTTGTVTDMLKALLDAGKRITVLKTARALCM